MFFALLIIYLGSVIREGEGEKGDEGDEGDEESYEF
jgi:hypothetical protein